SSIVNSQLSTLNSQLSTKKRQPPGPRSHQRPIQLSTHLTTRKAEEVFKKSSSISILKLGKEKPGRGPGLFTTVSARVAMAARHSNSPVHGSSICSRSVKSFIISNAFDSRSQRVTKTGREPVSGTKYPPHSG